MKSVLSLFLVLLISSFAQGLELTWVKGLIHHQDYYKGRTPYYESYALAPKNWKDLKGYNNLLPYVTPSPDQEDAHSCMLMSLTGIAEFWLNRYHSKTEFVPNSDLDLSERWWMNLSYSDKHVEKAKYWYSDAIYLFNSTDAARNRDYPLTKGWHTEVDFVATPAKPTDANAVYSVRYSWFSEVDKVTAPLVKLPRFARKVILKDKDKDPWAIGIAPADITDKVIQAMRKYQAPVQVIYNHNGVWHSVVVVGFDENMPTYGCPFIKETFKKMDNEIQVSKEENEPGRVAMFNKYKSELEKSFKKNGGCNPKGMFYVRDSFYSDPTEPMYVYDPSNPSMTRPHSKRVVLREFDWMRNLASHINVIYPVGVAGSTSNFF